jgi:hypothetical protein
MEIENTMVMTPENLRPLEKGNVRRDWVVRPKLPSTVNKSANPNSVIFPSAKSWGKQAEGALPYSWLKTLVYSIVPKEHTPKASTYAFGDKLAKKRAEMRVVYICIVKPSEGHCSSDFVMKNVLWFATCKNIFRMRVIRKPDEIKSLRRVIERHVTLWDLEKPESLAVDAEKNQKNEEEEENLSM